MTSPAQVVVVGAANLDLFFRAPRLPVAGETVTEVDFEESLGGKGANQAVAAARFGAAVSLVSSLGDDRAGQAFKQVLSAEDIDLTGCRPSSGQPTGRACVWLEGSGENRILVSPGANALLDKSAVARALGNLSDVSALLCQLETSVAGVEHAISWARGAGAMSILNAAPATPFRRLGAMPDLLVTNQQEAAQIARSADTSPSDLLRRIVDEFGIDHVIVTLGKEGALLWNGEAELTVEAPAVEPYDTTGAGDAFCGALASRLAAGDDWERAVKLACVAGAIATQRLGAMSSLPSLAQAEDLLGKDPASRYAPDQDASIAATRRSGSKA